MKIFKFVFSVLLFNLLHCNQDNIKILNKSNFDSSVTNDNAVWIVEIASKMCGSCQEFSPIFHSIANNYPGYKYGVIYVDDEEGMSLANTYGSALETGLPVVLMFDYTDGSYVQIVGGMVANEDEVKYAIKEYSKDLERRDDDFYIKKSAKIEL